VGIAPEVQRGGIDKKQYSVRIWQMMQILLFVS